MTNSTMDFSYTYGEDWTVTVGLGNVLGGNGTITLSSSGTKYKTESVSGFGVFGIVGKEWEHYEGLVGLRFNSFKYSDFQSQSTLQIDTIDETYTVSGFQLMFGVGVSF